MFIYLAQKNPKIFPRTGCKDIEALIGSLPVGKGPAKITIKGKYNGLHVL